MPEINAVVFTLPRRDASGRDGHGTRVELEIWDGQAYRLTSCEIDPTLSLGERIEIADLVARKINQE